MKQGVVKIWQTKTISHCLYCHTNRTTFSWEILESPSDSLFLVTSFLIPQMSSKSFTCFCLLLKSLQFVFVFEQRNTLLGPNNI